MASRPVYIVCDITISEARNFWGVVRNMAGSGVVADDTEVDAFLNVIKQWLEKNVLPEVLEYEHQDKYPAAHGRADARVRPLRRHNS